MKKILIFLMIILSLTTLYSQDYIRICSEPDEIMTEFKNYNPKKISKNNFDIIKIKVNVDGNEIIYSFDEFNYCYNTTIISKDLNTAKEFESYYREKNYYIGTNNIDLNKVNYCIFLNNDMKYVFIFRLLNKK